MNFEPLLNEQIISCKKFDSIASDVWEVSTPQKDVFVRTSTVHQLEMAPWTWGCYNLFGVDVRKVANLKSVNDTLRRYTNFIFPRVLKIGVVEGQTFAVMEKLNGTRFSLKNQPDEFVERFGACLAQLHGVHFNRFGNIDGSFSYTPNEFLVRMIDIMQSIVNTHFIENKMITDSLVSIVAEVSSIQAPECGSFIMLDMDERQYIADGNLIACVDTEGYAIGPRELDLVALEYSLDQRTSLAFQRGYSSIVELPKLEPCRRVYRFLYRLFEIKGPVEFEWWMNYPQLLP